MADQTKPRDAKPTTRLVLKRERVLVLPDGVDVKALTSGDGAKKLAEALGLKGAKVPTASIGVDAWLPIGEYQGASQTNAIEAYAGKPGTPDAKVGVFKAPSVTNWKGGAVYDAPPAPLVERKLLED